MGAHRLILAYIAAALTFAAPAAEAATAAPFTVSWIRGECHRCRTASGLAGVAYASDRDVWAYGFNPPGQTGAGDATVLHSRDGGHTWRELAWTYTHNDFPKASFVTGAEGWVGAVEIVQADRRIMRTHDGGASWRRIALDDLFTDQIQYVGGGAGFAASLDIYSKAAVLRRTHDNGRNWTRSALPKGLRVSQMKFVDTQRGYLAGCLDGWLALLGTSDAGRHWTQTAVNPGETPCDFEFDGLEVIGDGDEAWALANKHGFKIGDTRGAARMWRTRDGGRTWVPVLANDWREDLNHFIGYQGPYRIAPNRIVIFRDAADGRSEALVTGDGGKTWSSTPVDHRIAGCARTRTGLTCAAWADRGFWLGRFAWRGEPVAP